MDADQILVYATLAVSLVVLVASKVPAVLGPLGAGLARWQASRREARVMAGAADLADLVRQVAYLTGRVESMDAREQRWRDEWMKHTEWDQTVLDLLIEAGIKVPPRPRVMTAEQEHAL